MSRNVKKWILDFSKNKGIAIVISWTALLFFLVSRFFSFEHRFCFGSQLLYPWIFRPDYLYISSLRWKFINIWEFLTRLFASKRIENTDVLCVVKVWGNITLYFETKKLKKWRLFWRTGCDIFHIRQSWGTSISISHPVPYAHLV